VSPCSAGPRLPTGSSEPFRSAGYTRCEDHIAVGAVALLLLHKNLEVMVRAGGLGGPDSAKGYACLFHTLLVVIRTVSIQMLRGGLSLNFFTFLHFRKLLYFPAFLDEISHIDWANDLYELQPFTGARNGKLFGLWWMAIFGLQGNGALFLVRAATVLFNVLGAAALYSLARHLAHASAGVLVVILYALSPYSFFYSRMALVDSYVATWAVLMAWFAVRYVKRGRTSDAVLCGLALMATILAKATGIVLVIVPALAYFLLVPNRHWAQRVKGFLLSYSTFAVIATGCYVGLRWRGYKYFGTATSVVGTTESGNIISRTFRNIKEMWIIDSHYLSIPFILVAIVLAIYLLVRRRREALFLLGTTLVPLVGLLMFATKPSARYFQFHEPFLLLLVAVALAFLSLDLNQHSPLAARAVLVGGVVLWGGLFAAPFQAQYFHDPAALDLPALDRLEYIASDAAGFAVPEIADYLVEQARAEAKEQSVVVGLFANCDAMKYYVFESRLQVECPRLKLDGSHQPQVIALLDHLLTGDSAVWLVFEESPYISLDGIAIDLEETAVFTRPDSLTRLQVFRVIADS